MNKPSNVCAISFKESWQDEHGRWYSNGGFPLQMAGIASLFDGMTLLITRRKTPGDGGIPLPRNAKVIAIRKPVGMELRRKISVLLHLPYYVAVIREHLKDADVVHVPPPGDIPLIGMIMALILRKRMIVRYCGSWAATDQTTLTNRFTRSLMRLFAGGRNVMLATGDGEQPPAKGISWIFSTALSADELRASQPDCDRGLTEPARLVYIGRLHEIKGVSFLIKAIALLAQEGFSPLPTVAIIGEGPERSNLERQIAQGDLGSRVRLLGQLDRAGLIETLRGFDVCVQPSLSEGFSKAWLDAFAMGLPVLASDVGAARSVIGEDYLRGWLVTPGDVGELAAQLRKILTRPTDWPSLRRRCRLFVESRSLEAWSETIGQLCARQWNMSLVGGKLRERQS